MTAALASANQGSITFQNGFGTLTYTYTVLSGQCGYMGMGQWTEYEYTSLTYTDPAERNWGLGGGGTYYSSSGSQGCPPGGAQPPSIIYGEAAEGWVITWHPGAGGGSAGIELYGNMTPKYQILAVFYAPPGHASYIKYDDMTTVGTSVSLTQSFTQGYAVSVAASNIVTSSNSASTFSQEQDSSESVDISKTTGWGLQINGPQPDTVQTDAQMDALGLDHDYDQIMVWLDPGLEVSSGSGGGVTWNGYGINPARAGGDLEWVMLSPGQIKSSGFPADLNDHNNVQWYNPGLYANLQRTWDTTISSPALDSDDYSAVLAQDPFAHDPHASSTSVDLARYTPVPVPDVLYETNQVNQQYTASITQTDSQGYSEKIDFSAKYGWSNTYSVLEGLLSLSLTSTNTLDLVDKWSSTLTQKVGESTKYWITGPQAGSGYSGPDDFVVYQDNLYGTFMLYPATD